MTKTNLLAPLFLVLAAGVAHAGGQEGTIGVGAEVELNQAAQGISANYDAGKFHVGGFFGLEDPGANMDSTWSLGGRFFWHVHSTAMADFGVGGGVGMVSVPTGGNERANLIFIEPGVQTRAFIASNVALSFTAGIIIGAGDAEGVSLTGQFTGLAGVHYYFF